MNEYVVILGAGAGRIYKVWNCGGDGEGEGVITSLLFSYVTLGDCKDANDKNSD